MRIGYYVPATLLRHAGIRARSEQSTAAWVRLGHEAQLLAPSVTTPPLGTLGRHLSADAAAARAASAALARGDLDHCHVRLFLPVPAWVRLARDYPVTLEIHNRIRRPESPRDVVRVAGGAVAVPRLLRAARAGAFVTRELCDRPEFGHVVRRGAIGNGVLLEPELPAPRNDPPRLGMAVGTVAGWHGLDHFTHLAEALPRIRAVVVCPQALAPKVGAVLRSTRVEVVPTRDRDDYRAALAGLDAAIGSLALRRAGLHEAAVLKVRDYVSAGIPTVLPYPDTNLAAAADPALLHWRPGDPPDAVERWLAGTNGTRILETTRQLVSIDTVERQRLEIILGGRVDTVAT